jgi:hypothetical protein
MYCGQKYVLAILGIGGPSYLLIGVVKVASLQKAGKKDIIRPSWIFDCIKQNEVDAGMARLVLPLEPRLYLPRFLRSFSS